VSSDSTTDEPDDPAGQPDPDEPTGQPDPDDPAGPGASDDPPDPDAPDDLIGDAQEAIEEARRRLSDVPAEVVVTNHVMGLYELAAIHLSAPEPNLAGAALAIDALAYLVDGLGERLGADAATLRDALANIRMAFVQIKAAASPTATPADP